MRKIKSFLLACIMIISALSFNAVAAVPETAEPLWNNTGSVVLGHTRIGTTAHVNIDITIDAGATISDTTIKLFKMGSTETVLEKTWTNPDWTVDAVNTYNFYDTHSPVESGVVYQLVFQCKVWKNGTYDQISTHKNVQY